MGSFAVQNPRDDQLAVGRLEIDGLFSVALTPRATAHQPKPQRHNDRSQRSDSTDRADHPGSDVFRIGCRRDEMSEE